MHHLELERIGPVDGSAVLKGCCCVNSTYNIAVDQVYSSTAAAAVPGRGIDLQIVCPRLVPCGCRYGTPQTCLSRGGAAESTEYFREDLKLRNMPVVTCR